MFPITQTHIPSSIFHRSEEEEEEVFLSEPSSEAEEGAATDVVSFLQLKLSTHFFITHSSPPNSLMLFSHRITNIK